MCALQKDNFHIQSEESRKRTINRFCKTIIVSAVSSIIIYLYLGIYPLVISSASVGLLFAFFVYLNNKGRYKISQIAIIITTNLGIAYFSFFLGFNSGIYLYLFASPLLVYLLFDFNQQKKAIGFLMFYLFTFLIIYYFRDIQLSEEGLSENTLQFLYAFNFSSAFILSFVMIIYFAYNNHKYIAKLLSQQNLLMEEAEQRIKTEDLLRKSLREREILLSEVHHRVKNNLAIVSALINLQIEKIEDEEGRLVFEDTKNKIYSMALIHNLLYKNNSFATVNFKQYAVTFSNTVMEGLKTNKEIQIEHHIDDLEIDIKASIPLGLILNEMITNAYKHAFSGKDSGKIIVGLTKADDDHLRFWVADNGVGIKEGFVNGNTMGVTIITALAEQIDGTLTCKNDSGSNFSIEFPIKQN